MSEMVQTGFDYGALSSETALTARAAAERIKLRLKRTVEDIIEIGRELTLIKDQLPHGHFLLWVAAEFEMSKGTAQNFMAVFDRFGKNVIIKNFKPTVLYSLAAPSTPDSVVTQAIDKAESGEKVTVADVKAWKQRAEEFSHESNERRKRIRDLEHQVDLLKGQQTEKTVEVEKEVVPADYAATKELAKALEQEIEQLKRDQRETVDAQVRAKLRDYQDEVDAMEIKKAQLEDVANRKKAYLDSLDSLTKRIETHRQVIDGLRLELINLAAFLSDMDPIPDIETVRRWLALADMNREAAATIEQLFKRPLAVVQGGGSA